jgi:hypothetical protein
VKEFKYVPWNLNARPELQVGQDLVLRVMGGAKKTGDNYQKYPYI